MQNQLKANKIKGVRLPFFMLGKKKSRQIFSVAISTEEKNIYTALRNSVVK